MSEAKKPQFRVTLPAGVAHWPQLHEAKPFMKKGVPVGEPKYSIGVVYDDDDMREEVNKIIADAWKKLAPEGYKLSAGVTPWKTPEKGSPYFKAQTAAKYKPPLFDAKVNKLPDSVKIGGGSVVKIDVTMMWYKQTAREWGLTAYLNGVQVLKFEEDTWGKPNFDEEEGYEHPESDGASPFKPEEVAGELADF